MKKVLNKCLDVDLEYISKTLDSYLSLTNDRKRKKLLDEVNSNSKKREELISLIDKQIRYYGSSDVAYAARRITSNNGGISASELIDDVCSKSKVIIKKGGSVELKLEKLVTGAVEKELLSKSPEELAKAFEDIGVGDASKEQILEALKENGKVAILPIIVEVVGPKIALGIIETIIISMISQIIGKEAAKHLLKELVKRNPWINALGPVIWALSGVWLAVNLQGPAYRKTVPILLYLGIVALRDGEEIE